MKQFYANITASQFLTDSLRLLTLSSPDLPQLRAGQLVLVRANDSFDPYLRRAYFPLTNYQSPVTNSSAFSLLISTAVALAPQRARLTPCL
jgi:hypothetical protein